MRKSRSKGGADPLSVDTSERRRSTQRILVMRGLRSLAYGLLAVLLGVALAGEGFSPAAIGVLITVSLLGDMIGTYVIGLLADTWGRRRTLALYFSGMMVTIPLAFGWALYRTNGLVPFVLILFFMGFAGGNFAAFSLWLPEQYDTRVRATAFAFSTSVGRFVGAAVNFALAAAVLRAGSLGIPVALTGLAFGLGLLVIPFALETRGQRLPG